MQPNRASREFLAVILSQSFLTFYYNLIIFLIQINYVTTDVMTAVDNMCNIFQTIHTVATIPEEETNDELLENLKDFSDERSYCRNFPIDENLLLSIYLKERPHHLYDEPSKINLTFPHPNCFINRLRCRECILQTLQRNYELIEQAYSLFYNFVHHNYPPCHQTATSRHDICYRCKISYKLWICSQFHSYSILTSKSDENDISDYDEFHSNPNEIGGKTVNTDELTDEDDGEKEGYQIENIEACTDFCFTTESVCPYMNPIESETFGGVPLFFCEYPFDYQLSSIENFMEILQNSSRHWRNISEEISTTSVLHRRHLVEKIERMLEVYRRETGETDEDQWLTKKPMTNVIELENAEKPLCDKVRLRREKHERIRKKVLEIKEKQQAFDNKSKFQLSPTWSNILMGTVLTTILLTGVAIYIYHK
ncbi:hypothetical protein SNEBB_004370 [Seison nebaliae]|nr:hypothetical protein SNEBB_004370 [Seison nebaliae]